MDADDARTVGQRVRQIRKVRNKSLEVVAGLTGISTASLSRIENGLRALDSRSEIVALANALQVVPSELTKVDVPAPANGDKETAVKAIRRALIAVSRDEPAGQVVPVNVLRTRVATLTTAQRQCEYEGVGRNLPELIRDLHTTLAVGRDVEELFAVAVMLHVQGSHAFLHDAGAHPACAGRPPCWRGRPPENTAGPTCWAWPRSARRTGCWRPGTSTWRKPSWTR
ncbi:MAG: helix-turn-helix transcriptional regulator [Pseudonocardiales bacterium]|nr:helix-turn-helix transcriptional regulator [Pseudonocardiales bacterium]